MELFHIHKSNMFDESYYEGAELEVGKEPNLFRMNSLRRHASFLYETKFNEEGKEQYHYRDLASSFNIESINKMSDDQKKSFINALQEYITFGPIDNREMVLEEVRYKLYSDRPSRYKCIWLCSEEEIDNWLNLLKVEDNNYQIYKVRTYREPFLTNENLLPTPSMSKELMYECAQKYWNPTNEDLSINGTEYIYEGKIKLLKRVK